MKTLTAEQCKVGRTYLKWSQEDLAKKLKSSKKTITDFERGETHPYQRTLENIYDIFSNAGIKFEEDESISSVHLVKKEKNQIKTAQNNLTVIKAFLLGSEFEDLISRKVSIKTIPYDWSDRMLDDLSSSKLDLIVYNTNRVKKFISDRYLDNIEILDHCCYSMGGENFFLLGKKNIWKETSLEEFKRNIQKNDKTIIVISKNSDNIDNLSLLMDIDNPKLKIVNLPADNIRKEIFDVNPNVLICGSQNSRYNLLYQDDIIEVLNSNSINDKTIKGKITSNSENSFVVNKKIYDVIPKEDLLEIISLAKDKFHDLSKNKKDLKKLISSLLESVNHLTHSQDNAEFIVKNILYKTYRIGKPI